MMHSVLLLQEFLSSMCEDPPLAQCHTTGDPSSVAGMWAVSISITLGKGDMENVANSSISCLNLLPGQPSTKLCGPFQEDQPGQQAL